MKKLKRFSHDYYDKGKDIDEQLNDWVDQNPDVDVIQITASESANQHGRYSRTLYVLYGSKEENLLP